MPSRLELKTMMLRIKAAGLLNTEIFKKHAREMIEGILEKRKVIMDECKALHASATSPDSTKKKEALKNARKKCQDMVMGYFRALDYVNVVV